MYSQKTPYFGFPVLGLGDAIDPAVEMQRYSMIENLLIACTRSLGCCIFTEGVYAVESPSHNTSNVTLQATGGQAGSASGIVAGRYFECREPLRWNGLRHGHQYWLYCGATAQLIHDRAAIRAFWQESELEAGDRSAVLMATVDLRGNGDDFKLDNKPAGKRYSV